VPVASTRLSCPASEPVPSIGDGFAARHRGCGIAGKRRAGPTRAYGAARGAGGPGPADTAEAGSAEASASLLPDGRATPGHEVRSIVADTGEVVGVLWFAPGDHPSGTVAFIYDIEIDAAFRGRGYGRAAMAALEPLVRSLGYDTIALHVFGDNDVARNLYRTSGFRETDVTMQKDLG